MKTSLAMAGTPADSLEAALKLENRPEQKVKLLLLLSKNLAATNSKQELTFAREALRLAESTKDNKGIISATTLIASYYRKNGDLRKAITYGRQAMDLAIKYHFDESYIEAALVMAYTLDATGNYLRSTEMFFNCFKKSEKLNNQELKSKALYGIGYTCFSQNKFPKALEYYLKSLAISRELKDSAAISATLNNISAVYGATNDTQYVEKYLRESLAFNLKLKNQIWVSTNYNNLASWFMLRKQYDSAFHYLRKSYILAQSIHGIGQIANAYNGLARYYLATGVLDSGLTSASAALDLGRKFGFRKTIYESVETLRDIYFKKNDLSNAYKYDTLGYQLKDSLDLDENTLQLSKLELQYDLDKLEQEAQLVKQKEQAVDVIVIVSLVSLIVIFLLLYLRNRLKSRVLHLEKEKLEVELEHRNKELTSNVMSLMKKNETQAEITRRLFDFREKAVNDDVKKVIEEIASDLRKSMESGIWEEFDMRFRQVHTDFYEKLIQKHPALTPNELKLCAFLRLNMTNKEISELTGQSIKALEAARYRLRIKFGLSNSQVNLITFLTAI